VCDVKDFRFVSYLSINSDICEIFLDMYKFFVESTASYQESFQSSWYVLYLSAKLFMISLAAQ